MRLLTMMPFFLNAKTCGRLCGMTKGEWLELDAAGLTPSSLYLFGKKRWRRIDVEFWFYHECPGRGDSNLMPV